VLIWANIGALTTAAGTAVVDAIIYLDGNPLTDGGWNRFSIYNAANNALATTSLNSMILVSAGSHTIELRTARNSGSVSVNIGGNAQTDVNPGELTVVVLN
jgi:hypothetical protein